MRLEDILKSQKEALRLKGEAEARVAEIDQKAAKNEVVERENKTERIELDAYRTKLIDRGQKINSAFNMTDL